MKAKKPKVRFIIKIFLIENECKSFSSKNIFYDKINLRFFSCDKMCFWNTHK